MLSLFISIIAWLLAVVALAFAVQRSQRDLDERLVPLAGIMAAFIFTGQMINFPVAGGTSGHLVGAALAATVLGPSLGILVMTAVIALQALLFQDGGLLAMGANILVMSVLPALVGYGLYRLVANRTNRRIKLAGAALAAWLSVMAAALLDALPQTMLVSSHDLSLGRNLLPRTIVMDEGRVVADGPTDVVLSDSALLRAHGLDGTE